MLRGNYRVTVDAKGRLKIPAAFLPELRKQGDEFFVTSSEGTFAWIYTMREWEELEERMKSKIAPSHPTRRKFFNRTSYFGQVARADGQGRILIPPVLRESAELVGDVVVLGNQMHLEVWNHARFVEQQVRGNPWTLEDDKTLGDLGI